MQNDVSHSTGFLYPLGYLTNIHYGTSAKLLMSEFRLNIELAMMSELVQVITETITMSQEDCKANFGIGREWAPDRSPLQRLELTLDSITKEEKRARVEEAELLAREAKAGRGGEKAHQNSVRFRNRPVAKAPEPGSQSQPQSLPEAGLVRNLSNKQKDQLQRSGTVEKKRPVEPTISASRDTSRGFDYEPEDPKTTNLGNETVMTSTPQRGPSFRDRSYLPVAAGSAVAASAALSRSGSNKLKKAPPGDPWLHRRTEGEKKYPEVIAPRQPHSSVSERPHPSTSMAGPSRDTAFRSHPQVKEKELPSKPLENRNASPHARKWSFHFHVRSSSLSNVANHQALENNIG
jgi:hypothetical protein